LPQANSQQDTAVNRFWERFLDLAQRRGVKQAALRWHVRHAETYLKAVAGKRLATHEVSDVEDYLDGHGGLGRIPDWQFVQIVDAVELGCGSFVTTLCDQGSKG
jgi:hypothetical protein